MRVNNVDAQLLDESRHSQDQPRIIRIGRSNHVNRHPSAAGGVQEGRVLRLMISQKGADMNPETRLVNRAVGFEDRLPGSADFVGIPQIDDVNRWH